MYTSLCIFIYLRVSVSLSMPNSLRLLRSNLSSCFFVGLSVYLCLSVCLLIGLARRICRYMCSSSFCVVICFFFSTSAFVYILVAICRSLRISSYTSVQSRLCCLLHHYIIMRT